MTDRAFTTFPFNATGGSTPRTMPDRLGDVKNVKDFGAVGDGSADDTSAIQAAVDYTTPPYSSANRGLIFFPPGIYRTTAPITVATAGVVSIRFAGCGNASVIGGSVNGYVFDRSVASYNPAGSIFTFDGMIINNTFAGGGAIRLGNTVCASVSNCEIAADMGIICTQSTGDRNLAAFTTTITSCLLQPWNNWAIGSVGICVVNNSTVIDCDVSRFDKGVILYGTSNNLIGGRYEVNRTGILMGVGQDGTLDSADSYLIGGVSLESNGISIHMPHGCGSGLISGAKILGFQGSSPYEGTVLGSRTITGASSGASGTGTVSVDGILTISGVAGTLNPKYTASNVLNGGTWDYVTATSMPTKTFLYQQLTGTPGKDGTYQLKGSPSYGVYVGADCGLAAAFTALNVGGEYYGNAVYIGNSSNKQFQTYTSCIAGNVSPLGTAAWLLPATAHTATFVGCNTPTIEYTFANLPSGSNVVEGDEYSISDCNTATFLATAAAGGTGATAHRRVRWNASSSLWQVVG